MLALAVGGSVTWIAAEQAGANADAKVLDQRLSDVDPAEDTLSVPEPAITQTPTLPFPSVDSVQPTPTDYFRDEPAGIVPATPGSPAGVPAPTSGGVAGTPTPAAPGAPAGGVVPQPQQPVPGGTTPDPAPVVPDPAPVPVPGPPTPNPPGEDDDDGELPPQGGNGLLEVVGDLLGL